MQSFTVKVRVNLRLEAVLSYLAIFLNIKAEISSDMFCY